MWDHLGQRGKSVNTPNQAHTVHSYSTNCTGLQLPWPVALLMFGVKYFKSSFISLVLHEADAEVEIIH